MRFECRHCGGKSYWKLGNGEYRCKNCRKDSKPVLVFGMKLTRKEWVKLIDLFLLGVNSPTISSQIGRNVRTVAKALRLIREVMVKDVPDVFEGIVEVDETYLGGQKRNKSKSQLRKEREVFGKESKRGKGTTKQPVFGILCRSGKVFAELVDDTEAKDLIPIITRKVKAGTEICSDTYRSYTGLAAAGYVHRTVEHKEKEYVKGKNHINGLEGFWGFLKRKLASKGGVRRIYLPFFLGEYVWRYNHRKEKLIDQRSRLIGLITSQFGARY
jgi:transposase